MAIVTRGGRDYRYRAVRRDGRVTSVYGGSGEFARLMAETDAAEASARREARRQAAAERKQLDDLDRELDELVRRARSAAHAELFASGLFYLHKRQWRRRHGQ